MYPVVNDDLTKNSIGDAFWDKVSNVYGSIESNIPTFDNTLDTYFDRRFAAIIEEWDLVTEHDLENLDRRLTRITDDIDQLVADRAALESRVEKLDNLITTLERSV